MKSNPRRPASQTSLPGLAGGLLLMAALGSCSEPPVRPAPAAPPSAPVIAPAPTVVAPAPAVAWQDAAITPGDWQWQQGMASYVGPAGTVLSLVCQRGSGRLQIIWPGPTGAPTLEVETTTLARPLPAATRTESPALIAELPANDSLLDAMAFSRGRFAIEAAGRAPLVLPAWPEVARVVEDCR